MLRRAFSAQEVDRDRLQTVQRLQLDTGLHRGHVGLLRPHCERVRSWPKRRKAETRYRPIRPPPRQCIQESLDPKLQAKLGFRRLRVGINATICPRRPEGEARDGSLRN